MMTAIFHFIGESVNPMLELLPMLGNGPNIFIISSGLLILIACTNMLIKAKRDGVE